MRPYALIFLLIGFLVVGGLAFAKTTENIGLLPTNPFYFLKNWKHNVQMLFTFSPIAKAELELKFTSQKATELKKVQEIMPDNERGITRALQNYQESHENLKTRFEALAEDSQNPNVDRLLGELAERMVRHEVLVESVAEKLDNQSEVREVISDTKEKIKETVIAASEIDGLTAFESKLEKARGVLVEEALEIMIGEDATMEPEESVAPIPQPQPPVAAQCDALRRDLMELDKLLKAEEVSEYDYNIRYAKVRKALLDCK